MGRGARAGHRPVRRAQGPPHPRRDVRHRRKRGRTGRDPRRALRQRHGRGRSLPARPREARAGPQHAELSLGQLDLPWALLSGQCALSGLRTGVTGRRQHVQGQGWHWDHLRAPAWSVRVPWRGAPPSHQGREDRRRRGLGEGRRARRRRHLDRTRRRLEPRSDRHLHPAGRPGEPARTASGAGSRTSTTGPPTSRRTSP